MTQFVLASLLAANFRAIGLTIAVLFLSAFVALFLRNVAEARKELGSEVELAANRVPYLDDEDLEGTKLDRSLTFALGILTITAISLPFYWLAEPGRQEGAIEVQTATFVRRGAALYTGGAQCVNCHAAGGVGGQAPYVLQDGDGQFLANANWSAPALNNVLGRYSEEEVTYILNFGRPGSPMAAWGAPGGGPLTSQQVEYLIEYLKTFQTQSLDPIDIQESEDPDAASEAAQRLEEEIWEEVNRSVEAGEFTSVGEAGFNLGLFSGFKAGSLSCGRCHTAGWSLGLEAPEDPLSEGVAACGGGISGIGFSLCGGIHDRFPDDAWKLPSSLEPGAAPADLPDSLPRTVRDEIAKLGSDWLPTDGLPTADGFAIISEDLEVIELDDKKNPMTGRVDPITGTVLYEILEDGDLADCQTYSAVWYPGDSVANAYPFDADHEFEEDPDSGGFLDPPELLAGDLSGTVLELSDGRLGGDCTVVEMPDRTSVAHYDFVYNGADEGAGYGRGGQSAAGLMPGFGKTIPADLLRAIIDYERGLE